MTLELEDAISSVECEFDAKSVVTGGTGSLPTVADNVIEKIGLEYDEEVGIHVHKKTHIPLTIYYEHEDDELVYLDQTKLPFEVTTWRTKEWKQAADPGIKEMIIRGSQAIGVAGGYCMLLAAVNTAQSNGNSQTFMKELKPKAEFIANTRPTAQPLPWAVNLAMAAAEKAVGKGMKTDDIVQVVRETADYILASDLALNACTRREIRKHLKNGDVILHHCNAGLAGSYGAHATCGIEEAYADGMDLTLISHETRPRSQGFKLTVWEALRCGLPVIAITDGMTNAAIHKYGLNKAMLGVDRVSRDGSVANKIGSADAASVFHEHGLPFYYCTSYSTIDLDTEFGKDIPIEERNIDEFTYPYRLEAQDKKRRGIISANALNEWPPNSLITTGGRLESGKVLIFNPAFDVTPPEHITEIIMDIGSYEPNQIKKLTNKKIDNKVRENLKEWGVTSPLEKL
nr:S-methyl-5-thioribose-1-phosphate isomerase [Candidatus Njordarchaeota archaeon]